MTELEKYFGDDDVCFLDSLSRHMDRHKNRPGILATIGRTAAKLCIRTGEILAANYSLDTPRGEADETL
jgi:hypothetical protein